jgi:acyl-CoA thioesterase I
MNTHHPLTACLAGVLLWTVLGAARAEPAPADAQTYLAPVSALMKQAWPHNRRVHVVCHGHSVPAGYFVTPVVDSPNAYPHLLFLGLKERFPLAVVNVIVTAVGGENSERGAARFEQDVLALHPDVVCIDYALNDHGLGLDRSRRALTAMITAALERDIRVMLLTPTPDQQARWNDPDDPLNQQADLIRALAAEHGVGLVDSLAAFQRHTEQGGDLADLMAQVNHPNRQGHELVAQALLAWFPE